MNATYNLINLITKKVLSTVTLSESEVTILNYAYRLNGTELKYVLLDC